MRYSHWDVLPAVRLLKSWLAWVAFMPLGACAPADDTASRDETRGGGTGAVTSDQRAPRQSAASPSSSSVLLPGGAFRAVSAYDSQLIAVGRDSGGRGVVFLSNDGTRWTHVATQPPTLPSLDAVVVWRDGFVAFADSGSAMLWTSKDGRAWTPIRPTPRAFADAGVRDIVAGGPGLVAVGYQRDPGETSEPVAGLVWTSRDGVSWTRVDDPRTFDLDEGTINSVTVGGPGLVAAGADINGSVVWTSRDGARWERVRDPAAFAGTAISAITVSPDGLLALGGRMPDHVAERWTSRDGRTWTRERANGPFDVRNSVSDVTLVGDRFVAVGGDRGGGAMWASDDGRSWTLVADSRRR